jgi:thioredoxin reductase (NADPH)
MLLREGIAAKSQNNRICVDVTDGEKVVARANICATGVQYRRLNLPNEKQFLDRGLYYGAGAGEAQMCGGDHLFVVGGGNGLATATRIRAAKQGTVDVTAI